MVLHIFLAIRDAGLNEMFPKRYFSAKLGNPMTLVEKEYRSILGIFCWPVRERVIASVNPHSELVEVKLLDPSLKSLMEKILPAVVSVRSQFTLSIGE